MRKINIALLGIIILSFLISFYFYPKMPEQMASHWNIDGNVDGYLPKYIALFIMPVIGAILYLVFMTVPKIDPLKSNVKKFMRYYELFVLIIFIFLFYLHLITLMWSVGFRFNIIRVLSPAFALLYFYCGVLIENAERNWFVGLRTPWTLSNNKVWQKTHKRGGKLFKVAGVLALVGLLAPRYAIFLVLAPMILVIVYTFIYSYLEFNKEKNIKPKKKKKR